MSKTQSDPVEDKIRELQKYDEKDDRDSSVNIVVEPGAVLNMTQASESEAPARMFKLPKWAKIVVAGVSALVGVGAVVQAVLDLLRH